MEFIRTIREKHQTKRQMEIQQEAEDTIYLADFEQTLYIAFNGAPLMPISEDLTAKEIMQKLISLRNSFIYAKCKKSGVPAPPTVSTFNTQIAC